MSSTANGNALRTMRHYRQESLDLGVIIYTPKSKGIVIVAKLLLIITLQDLSYILC